MSIEEQIFKYVSDLQNIPLSIHRIWRDFNQNNNLDKVKFIEIFHRLPKIYSRFRVVYHMGCPYLLYSKKEIWQISQNEYKDTSLSEISDSDILRYFLDSEEEVDIHQNFVGKIIQQGEVNNLKIILEYFRFTEEDLDLFLSLVNEKRLEYKEDDRYVDILLDLYRTKYELIREKLISKKNDLEKSYNLLEKKYEKLQQDYQEIRWMKITFICSFVIGLGYHLVY
jgi:hypothetical protein